MTDQHRKPALESRVRAVWRLTQRKNFSAGLLALCRWSVVLFLVGMTIDWLTFLPSLGRDFGGYRDGFCLSSVAARVAAFPVF